MASIEIPGGDANFVSLLEQFNTAAAEYGESVGLTAPQVEAISDAATAFTAAYTASEAAKNAQKGAVSTKNETRRTTTDVIREAAAIILASPEATKTIIAAFGMNPDPTSSGPVETPISLVANAASNGNCALTWNRNGNAQSTVFVLESKSATSDWAMFGTTTKSKFTDPNAAPGVVKFYRVRAERAGETSGYSNETVIYSAGSPEMLALAA